MGSLVSKLVTCLAPEVTPQDDNVLLNHQASLNSVSRQICAQISDNFDVALPLIEYPDLRRIVLPCSARNSEKVRLGQAVFIRWPLKSTQWPSNGLSCLNMEPHLDYRRPMCMPISESIFDTMPQNNDNDNNNGSNGNNFDSSKGYDSRLTISSRVQATGKIIYGQRVYDAIKGTTNLFGLNESVINEKNEYFEMENLNVSEADMGEFFEYLKSNDIEISSQVGYSCFDTHIGVISKIITNSQQFIYNVSSKHIIANNANLSKFPNVPKSTYKIGQDNIMTSLIKDSSNCPSQNAQMGHSQEKPNVQINNTTDKDNTMQNLSTNSTKCVQITDLQQNTPFSYDLGDVDKSYFRIFVPANSILAYEVIIFPVSSRKTLKLSTNFRISILSFANKIANISKSNIDSPDFDFIKICLHSFLVNYLLKRSKKIDKLLKKIKNRNIINLIEVAMFIDTLNDQNEFKKDLSESIKHCFSINIDGMVDFFMNSLILMSELTNNELYAIRYNLINDPELLNSFDKMLSFIIRNLYESRNQDNRCNET